MQVLFAKYSEQAWDSKGQMIKDTKVLSKKGALKLSKDILNTWKNLTDEENESYIQQNFEQIWNKIEV